MLCPSTSIRTICQSTISIYSKSLCLQQNILLFILDLHPIKILSACWSPFVSYSYTFMPHVVVVSSSFLSSLYFASTKLCPLLKQYHLYFFLEWQTALVIQFPIFVQISFASSSHIQWASINYKKFTFLSFKFHHLIFPFPWTFVLLGAWQYTNISSFFTCHIEEK